MQKRLAFNTPGRRRVAVVILSGNDPVSGLRIFRSASAAGMQLERGVFTRRRDMWLAGWQTRSSLRLRRKPCYALPPASILEGKAIVHYTATHQETMRASP